MHLNKRYSYISRRGSNFIFLCSLLSQDGLIQSEEYKKMLVYAGGL